MRDYEELLKALRENAEWAEGNIWEVPIMLPDNLKQAADAIEELQAYADLYKELTEKGQTVARKLIDAYPKWISVEERLPEEGERVLILYELRGDEENISIGWLANGGFDCWDDSLWTMRSVTYWMPMPEPPKEDGNG